MGNTVNAIIKSCPCGQKPRPETRTVYLNNNHPPGEDVHIVEKFPTNRIVSSKYTAWNFLPKNLWEQFHRIANFYFLCVALVEVVIDSPVSPMTTILPLIFVITVTAIKQGYEDWLRHKADKEVNHRPSKIVRDGQIQEAMAMDIRVGDIVRVGVNEGIPCDMVMLSSDDPEGTCLITTANLDGETNLKTFYAVPGTRAMQTQDSLESLHATIECEQPIPDLYRFLGRINIYNGEQKATTPLGPENILLRGARLKNTSFVYGCAIYTGQDTKISLNSKNKSLKFSRIEKRMNIYLIVFLVFLLVYPAIWVGLKHWFYSIDKNSGDNMWYIDPEDEASVLVILEEYLAFMVLCNYIIPISLYVTIEMQKFVGSMFFAWDVEMYDATTNEPAIANTSDLNEELGQVEYLFTDKTGTLTENVMQFRQCSVAGEKYMESGGVLCKVPDIPGVPPSPLSEITPEIEELLTVLILCHTCHVERSDKLQPGEFSSTGFDYDYQASSPDEKAFLEAARRYGYVYHGLRDDKMVVSFQGRMAKYIVHHILDFDPTRKRMSVIIEDEEGNHQLLVKGAETAILDLVVEGDIQTVNKHIMDYAMLGLRTLCIAKRDLNPTEFQEYDILLSEARKSIMDREERLQEAFREVEQNFKLVGATAVEDKLQDGVPETITALREAGIQVWVLTGDKEETAVNISYSAGHFKQGMTELRVTRIKDEDECMQVLTQCAKALEDERRVSSERKHALIVDGASLAYAMSHHRDMLQDICENCVTVLCCRMTPIQKAEVVRLMKQSKSNPTTAAIGDGANDVSMIQEAHVGLGIYGKEGRQAVRCSDYAFGKFRFLRRALLVHGHYFYVRLAVMVQYFFYKNVAMITSQLYFTFFSGFTYQSFFESFFLMFFNVSYTSLPILLYGLQEQPVRKTELFEVPQLYLKIRRNARLSAPEFIKWNLLGLWHSIVFFFGTYFAFQGNAPDSDGQMYGIYEAGAIVMTTCVIAVNIKLMLETYYWNGIIFFGFFLTFAGYYALAFLYSSVMWEAFTDEYPLYGSMEKILSNWNVWLLQLILCMGALLPDICLRAYTDTFSDVYKFMKPKKEGEAYNSRTELAIMDQLDWENNHSTRSGASTPELNHYPLPSNGSVHPVDAIIETTPPEPPEEEEDVKPMDETALCQEGPEGPGCCPGVSLVEEQSPLNLSPSHKNRGKKNGKNAVHPTSYNTFAFENASFRQDDEGKY